MDKHTSLATTTTQIDRVLSEFTSGFLFIGFHPITGQAMLVARTVDQKTCLAINAIMGQLMVNGGIVHQTDDGQ